VDAGKLPVPVERESKVCPVHHYRGHWNPPPKDREEVMRQRVAYAESIVHIDRQIGRILGALDEHGMLETTTVIFSSDHGDLIGDHGQLEKGPFAFSGQLNVPLILANHPAAPWGARSSILTGNLDIPGTVLDVAGSEDGLGVSRSLIAMLPADSPLRREVNFAECAGTMKLVETERHRFAVYPFTGFRELYDRKEDPGDRHNLAGRPEFRDLEMDMMLAAVDHMVICNDVQIGGFDLTPEIQERLRRLHPRFDRPGEFRAAFPLMKRAKEALKESGIDPNYTNWFRQHEILAHYGLDFEEM
jgi:arylsulfatase A-like enzyme